MKGERLMVNSSEALEKFQVWIDENTDLPVFDHAVLFTGYVFLVRKLFHFSIGIWIYSQPSLY